MSIVAPPDTGFHVEPVQAYKPESVVYASIPMGSPTICDSVGRVATVKALPAAWLRRTGKSYDIATPKTKDRRVAGPQSRHKPDVLNLQFQSLLICRCFDVAHRSTVATVDKAILNKSTLDPAFTVDGAVRSSRVKQFRAISQEFVVLHFRSQSVPKDVPQPASAGCDHDQVTIVADARAT